MNWANLIPAKRSRFITSEVSDTHWRERTEKKIKKVLNFNARIKFIRWLLFPAVSAAIVWFGWDLYGHVIHNLGGRENHLGFLWKAVSSLFHGDAKLLHTYFEVISKNGLTAHVASFFTVALLLGWIASLLFKRLLLIYELMVEVFVEGARASHDVKHSIAYLKKEFKGEKDCIQVAPDAVIPEDVFSKHMVAFGTTGVGKTQILWNILTAILSKKKSDFKLCLFDFKADFIKEYIDRPDFGLIAAYDERSMWWDFMQDIHSTLDIESLAYQLVPAGEEKDPFWRNTARNLVIDAIAYMKKANLKGWATLYKLLGDRKLILAAIEKSGGASAQSIAKENNTSNSVMTTLNEAVRPIGILAKAWGDDGSGCQSISIAKWVANDPSVPKHLIFGWDENYAHTLAPIFAAFMDGVLASKLSPESDNRIKIFMAWDEFASIPAKVTKLATALRTGRSIGVSFFLGCLNINDIYHRYGQHEGKTILSLLRTQFGLLVGNADGAESARYISNSWGEQTIKTASWKKVPVQHLDDDGKQQTRMEWEISWDERKRKAVGESVFTESLGSVRQAGCVEGYAKFENLKPCKLQWKFYTPKGENPPVIHSPALMNEFDDIGVVENILDIANTPTTTVEEPKEISTHREPQTGKGLSDSMREKIKRPQEEKEFEPDFEEFPDDMDIPEEFEVDES